MDEKRLFLCSVIQELPREEDMQEAHESSAQCHEQLTGLDCEAWDDVNNCKLDPLKVRKAREEEMEYFRRMQVYRKVPIQRRKDETGKLPIKVRWVDTNKQDESNPKYRSRLVAKDFKKHSDPELYTATPPIEMLRWVISVAATGLSRKSRTRKVMINDAARVYFNAPSLSPHS